MNPGFNLRTQGERNDQNLSYSIVNLYIPGASQIIVATVLEAMRSRIRKDAVMEECYLPHTTFFPWQSYEAWQYLNQDAGQWASLSRIL